MQNHELLLGASVFLFIELLIPLIPPSTYNFMVFILYWILPFEYAYCTTTATLESLCLTSPFSSLLFPSTFLLFQQGYWRKQSTFPVSDFFSFSFELKQARLSSSTKTVCQGCQWLPCCLIHRPTLSFHLTPFSTVGNSLEKFFDDFLNLLFFCYSCPSGSSFLVPFFN